MLIDTQPRRPERATTDHCRRCREPRVDGRLAGVCVACRAQEEVARHIPASRRWLIAR